MGFFATIVVGLIAGFITSKLMRTNTGLLMDLILGVVGGFVGGWLTALVLHKDLMTGIHISSIIVALIGSVIVVAVYRLITRGRV